MAFLPKALCIFGVLLALSLEFSNGSSLPASCNCGRTKAAYRLQYVTDMSIHERGDRCGNEIILTVTRGRAVNKICLDPNKWQGQALLDCWTNTIRRDESRKAECLQPLRPRSSVESRTATTEATSDFTVTKELLFPSTATSGYTSTTGSSSSSSSS